MASEGNLCGGWMRGQKRDVHFCSALLSAFNCVLRSFQTYRKVAKTRTGERRCGMSGQGWRREERKGVTSQEGTQPPSLTHARAWSPRWAQALHPANHRSHRAERPVLSVTCPLHSPVTITLPFCHRRPCSSLQRPLALV